MFFFVYLDTMNKKNTVPTTTSCGAIVYRKINDDNGEILLIKQFAHKETWGIPKGHVDKGESIEECAIREVTEETGVVPVLLRRLQDCKPIIKKENKTVVTFFAVPLEHNAQINISDPDCEVADARWFSIDELPKLIEYQKNVIHEAVDFVRATLDDTTDDH